MNQYSIRLLRRDARFISLVLLNLLALALYLGQGALGVDDTGKAWRKIDIQAIQRLLDAGELSDREALWYHQTGPDEPSIRAGR